MPDRPVFNGACHCGSVRFTVRLVEAGLKSARRCTCTICRMHGAVALAAPLEDLQVTAGEDRLTEYRFNTGVARHFFCSVCGIYTHHQRRSDPSLYAVNAACLEGLSPFDFAEVPVVDGINHVRDSGDPSGKPRQIGVLRYDER
jgi:hypothetical protein